MGGKGSGRNPECEVNISRLANMSIGWCERNFNALDTDQKLKVVTSLAPKYVVQQLQHSGDAISMIVLKYAKDS